MLTNIVWNVSCYSFRLSSFRCSKFRRIHLVADHFFATFCRCDFVCQCYQKECLWLLFKDPIELVLLQPNEQRRNDIGNLYYLYCFGDIYIMFSLWCTKTKTKILATKYIINAYAKVLKYLLFICDHARAICWFLFWSFHQHEIFDKLRFL